MAVKIFRRVSSSVIGLWRSRFPLGLSDLGSRIMIPVVNESGMVLESSMLFNAIVICSSMGLSSLVRGVESRQ